MGEQPVAVDARSVHRGFYSSWLTKVKQDGAKAKWLSSSCRRYFTIDFNTQSFYYSHAQDQSKQCHPIPFREILEAQQLPQRTDNGPGRNNFGFMVRTKDKHLELYTTTYSDAQQWVDALNAAVTISQGEVQKTSPSSYGATPDHAEVSAMNRWTSNSVSDMSTTADGLSSSSAGSTATRRQRAPDQMPLLADPIFSAPPAYATPLVAPVASPTPLVNAAPAAEPADPFAALSALEELAGPAPAAAPAANAMSGEMLREARRVIMQSGGGNGAVAAEARAKLQSWQQQQQQQQLQQQQQQQQQQQAQQEVQLQQQQQQQQQLLQAQQEEQLQQQQQQILYQQQQQQLEQQRQQAQLLEQQQQMHQQQHMQQQQQPQLLVQQQQEYAQHQLPPQHFAQPVQQHGQSQTAEAAQPMPPQRSAGGSWDTAACSSSQAAAAAAAAAAVAAQSRKFPGIAPPVGMAAPYEQDSRTATSHPRAQGGNEWDQQPQAQYLQHQQQPASYFAQSSQPQAQYPEQTTNHQPAVEDKYVGAPVPPSSVFEIVRRRHNHQAPAEAVVASGFDEIDDLVGEVLAAGAEPAPKAPGSELMDGFLCTACDHEVLRIDGHIWRTDVEYMFFRNTYPNAQKLRKRMAPQRGCSGYCCQCSWKAAEDGAELLDIAEGLRWRVIGRP